VIMRMPEVSDKLAAQGADPITATPEQFGAYIRSEIEKWAKVVGQARISAE
jgi:tripartite-type tricarboxylate transporter receptor subunit TctC